MRTNLIWAPNLFNGIFLMPTVPAQNFHFKWKYLFDSVRDKALTYSAKEGHRWTERVSRYARHPSKMARMRKQSPGSRARIDPSIADPLAAKPRKAVPFEFVLDALAPVSPWTRPMFGCTAIYMGEKIVLILRQRPSYERDNGVWLATTHEHHGSLREEFPNMRSIGLLGEPVSNWQVLPVDAPDFEESAMRACELVVARDPRIGRIPQSRKRSGRKAPAAKAGSRKRTTKRKKE